MVNPINERLQILELLDQGLDPDALVRENLGQHQQAFQQEAERVTEFVREIQTFVTRRGNELVGEMEAIDACEPAELQVKNLQETLKKAQRAQRELLNVVEESKQKLEETTNKKRELIEFEQQLNNALKTPNATCKFLQGCLYDAGNGLNTIISKNSRGKDEYIPPARPIDPKFTCDSFS